MECKTVLSIYYVVFLPESLRQFGRFICEYVNFFVFLLERLMHGSVRQFGRSLCCHVKCVFVVFLLVLPGGFRSEMSGDIPKDPSELAKWLRREKNLRSDICKVLKGKHIFEPVVNL